eukprot:scaffold86873_cov21-Tisochrysis_lutea.AAC.2
MHRVQEECAQEAGCTLSPGVPQKYARIESRKCAHRKQGAHASSSGSVRIGSRVHFKSRRCAHRKQGAHASSPRSMRTGSRVPLHRVQEVCAQEAKVRLH